jgi:very-short-patch-repair endonuclease
MRERNPRQRILPYNPKLQALARALRMNMTLSEVLLWNELKQKQLLAYDFDRQRPIGEYIVDFYCKDLMLAIEVDGESHDTEEAQLKDRKRQNALEAMGVRFLRFSDLDVKNNIRGVVDAIRDWIRDNSP